MMVSGMDRFVELSSDWLSLLVLAAWKALPLIVIAIGVGLALRNRLSPKVQTTLWMIVIVRLLLPVSIDSPFSLHGAIDKLVERDGKTIEAQLQTSATDPSQSNEVVRQWVPQASPAYQVQNERRVEWDLLATVACFTAILGISCLLILRGIFSHVRFSRQLRACRKLESIAITQCLDEGCNALQVQRRPMIIEVPKLAHPAVFGFIRPAICLPLDFASQVTEQELGWVFRHELAHIKRRDTVMMVIASLAQALHWFNPLVWLSTSRLRRAMESAADDMAVGTSSTADSVAYGKLLLRLAQAQSDPSVGPILGLLPFASSKQLKYRVERIVQTRPLRSRRYQVLTGVCVLVLAVIGLTDAADNAIKDKPDLHLLDLPQADVRITLDTWNAEEDDGVKVSRTYSVGTLINSMHSEMPSEGLELKEQLCRWVPGLTAIRDSIEVNQESLVASLTETQHDRLKRTLEIWEHGEPKQISIETRFIRTSLEKASSIDWIAGQIPTASVAGSGPAMASLISEETLAKLIRSFNSDRSVNILFAPKLTTFEGQTAVLANETQHPFVTGISAKGNGKFEPQVTVIGEGYRLATTACLRETGSISLDINVKASKVQSVSYANLPVRHPDQTQPYVTVQVPSVNTNVVNMRVELKPGESAIIVIPEHFQLDSDQTSAGTTMLVTITPRLLESE